MPLHKGWQRAATDKPEYLVKAWRKAPQANIGIACRNITVLDADSARGVDAVEELGLPATTTVRTSRGCHFYFQGRGPNKANLLPDVEVRGSGSGVLGAGSIHPTGFEYVWEIPPWEVLPVPIPPELGHLLDQRKAWHTGENEGFVFEGGRRVHLLRVAGSLRGRYGVPELVPVLQAINEVQCRPPLTEPQVEKIARDAGKYAYPPPWLAEPIAFCNDPRLGNGRAASPSTSCRPCLPGWPLLSRYQAPSGVANASPNTILKAIAELEEAGRIKAKRSPSGNRYSSYGCRGGVVLYQLLKHWGRPGRALGAAR